MKIAEQIRQWYRGTLVAPRPNDPNSAVVFFQLDHYQQPLLAKALGVGGRLWLANWKWIITTALAALTLVLAKFH